MRFLREGDKRTGYRTKQMLVAPILGTGTNELAGVVQKGATTESFEAARARRERIERELIEAGREAEVEGFTSSRMDALEGSAARGRGRARGGCCRGAALRR